MNKIENTLKMIHHVRLVKGDDSLKVKTPKQVKATVQVDKEVLDAIRQIMDFKKTDSATYVLQGFLNKTFGK